VNEGLGRHVMSGRKKRSTRGAFKRSQKLGDRGQMGQTGDKANKQKFIAEIPETGEEVERDNLRRSPDAKQGGSRRNLAVSGRGERSLKKRHNGIIQKE